MNTVSNVYVCVFYANVRVTLNVHIHEGRREKERMTSSEKEDEDRKRERMREKATVMMLSRRLSREDVWATRINNHLMVVKIITMQTIGWNRWVDNQVLYAIGETSTYTFFLSTHAESFVRISSLSLFLVLFSFSSSLSSLRSNDAREKIYL